ncbi:hypothetical protein Tco_0741144, partial [Tanacetum coccineum]
MELEKVVKERGKLKLKTEKWEESSKNLSQLLNSQMSARDKTGLGYWKRISDKRTKNEAKNDKTEHRMEKRGQAKVKKSTKSKPKVKKSKSTKST